MNVQNEICQLIRENVLMNNDIILTPDTDLLNDIGMDSLTLILLVVLIEEKFAIQLPDDFLTNENLSKISNSVSLVQSLRCVSYKQ